MKTPLRILVSRPDFHREAQRQYAALWREIEADWLAQGEPK